LHRAVCRTSFLSITNPINRAQGSEEGHVYIWDIVEGKVARTLKHHRRPVCSMSYHP
ncbi:unnamed protein product, partial [Ectocarpus sp. 12 AP-2014]